MEDSILVHIAYDPSGQRQESRALGATISGMRHRCRLRPYHTPFDPFEQTGSVGLRWGRWKTRLQYYIDAREITVDNRKRALLPHLAGPAVQDIFTTLSDTGTSYMEALTALNTCFTPQKS